MTLFHLLVKSGGVKECFKMIIQDDDNLKENYITAEINCTL